MLSEKNIKSAHAKYIEGLALHRQGLFLEAEKSYQVALEFDPKYFDALHLLGVTRAQAQDYKSASEYFRRATNVNPANAMAWFNFGNTLSSMGSYRDAINCYDKAIEINPGYFAAHNGLGNALKCNLQLYEAIISYKNAIFINENYIDAYCNIVVVWAELNNYKAVAETLVSAQKIAPNDANLARYKEFFLNKKNKHDAYIFQIEKQLGRKFVLASDYCAYGNILRKDGEYLHAITFYDQAIAIRVDYAEAYFGRGCAMVGLNRQKEAIECFDRVKSYDDQCTEAYIACGSSLLILQQYEAAIECFSRALLLDANSADIRLNLGNAYLALKQYDKAISSYERTFQLSPDVEHYVRGQLLHAKMAICDWDGFDNEVEKQILCVNNNKKCSTPFSLLACIDSLSIHKKVAENYAQDLFPPRDSYTPSSHPTNSNKVRIAYFSMDFGDHPVAYLSAGLFELHDRSIFEVYAISFASRSEDEARTRLERAFDKFIEVEDKSDQEVIDMVRALNIDIAVDMAGFTHNCRTGIFSNRVAPVQISYLGYPATMGANYIDYIVADKVVIPEEYAQHYSEKIIYLPHSYMVNECRNYAVERKFSREMLGLPPKGVVFCCFNGSFKITPSVFEGWMRIISQVEGSVLWLAEGNAESVMNLRKQASIENIDPSRLIFAERTPLFADHLARYCEADLFLDTFPYNAHTTACDALWAGLPVLTCMGETFASRVAGSLLAALGMNELITHSPAEYEAKAIELALNTKLLIEVKNKLLANRDVTAVFKTDLYAKNLERAYTAVLDRSRKGLMPDHIFIE